MTDITVARALRARQAAQWSRQIAELPTWRPTPTLAETNRMAAGDIVMSKEWDRSPVDWSAFDPGEPPEPPPLIITQPEIIGLPEVGATLIAQPGQLGEPVHAYEWKRNGAPIPGATGLTYTLVDDDIGAMIGFAARARMNRVAEVRHQVGPVVRP